MKNGLEQERFVARHPVSRRLMGKSGGKEIRAQQKALAEGGKEKERIPESVI